MKSRPRTTHRTKLNQLATNQYTTEGKMKPKARALRISRQSDQQHSARYRLAQQLITWTGVVLLLSFVFVLVRGFGSSADLLMLFMCMLSAMAGLTTLAVKSV